MTTYYNDRMERTEAAAHQRRLREDEIAMQRRPATMPENVITRWECPYEDCATPFGASCVANLSGECIAAERTYVAVDVLHEWIDERRDEAKQWDTPAARSHCLLLGHLSALLDALTGGDDARD